MFLINYDSNRVLIWNNVPTSENTPADVALGAADLNSDGDIDCNASHFNHPDGMWAVDGKLIVADSFHNRVLIWNTIPNNNTAADLVLGQKDFNHCQPNASDMDGNTLGALVPPTAESLFEPSGVWSDGTRLVIIDTLNNRALIWNSFPTSNFTAADAVLGQGDFTHNTNNDDNQDNTEDTTPSAHTLQGPSGLYQLGKQLIITDSGNHRYLIYNGQ